MYTLARTAILLILLTACVPAAAQTAPSAKQPGSITGRVTFGGKAVIHAVVLLYGTEGIGRPAMAKTSTDQDGRYRFDNLAVGQYSVRPSTPAYVAPEISRSGKGVSVYEGEAVENVDFSLVRGGVITGRVTDSQGRPVIGEPVQILTADPNGNWTPTQDMQFTTDDRGIYRVYGQSTGRYIVAAGQEASSSRMPVYVGRPNYRRTFHPDAAEQSRAKAFEVNTGDEVTGVDIALGRAGKRYSATGRLIDATTGKPAANMPITHGVVTPDGKGVTAVRTAFRSDMRGNFRLEALLPGRYVAYVMGGQNQGSTDPMQFEITDKDVTGLELKLKSGITINGQVTITGADNPAAGTQISQPDLYVYATSGELSVSGYTNLKISPDGSFRLAGLTPGRLKLDLSPGGVNKNFSILQIEKDGVPQNEGITISPDDQAINLRVVIGYGAGTVRGQVKIENGELPQGAQVQAMAVPAGKSHVVRDSLVDARGRFLFEGLATGEYVIVINIYARQSGNTVQMVKHLRETVSVTSGSESQVVLTVNMAPDKKEDR